jgi:hypothetical protein
MKRIYEMTEAEILVLDETEISKLIDFECALDGIPMLPPHPGNAPVSSKCEPDMTAYEVSGIFFTSISDAANVLDAINNAVAVYKTDGWSDDKHLIKMFPGEYGFPKIETQKLVSDELFREKRAEIEAVKTVKGEWDRAKRIYDETYKQRESIVEMVYNKARMARDNAYEQESYRSEFRRYLELADNNATIAMNFITKAKPSIQTDFPALVQELCPGYGQPTCEEPT